MSWLLLLLLSFLLPVRPAPAQEMALPVDVQWPLFDRILAYDRGMEARIGEELVVGILYQSLNRASLNSRDEVMQAAQDVETRLLDGSRIRLVAIEATSSVELEAVLQAEAIDLLYITPLRSYDLKQLGTLCRKHGIATMTGVRSFVEEGVGIGLGLRGERPEIVVNLKACKEQGIELSSEILKLATIYGHDR